MGMREDIIATAQALQMDPLDLATIIHYESGFNPEVWGGAGGRHYGLIQFGPNERAQYGVDVNNPASQWGPEGAIAKYYRDRGWKPGMSFEDAYSIVNAGGPGRGSASDTAAGGRAGNVSQKVVSPEMMASRKAASAVLNASADASNVNEARKDTPSSAHPVGSTLPGPTNQYQLPTGNNNVTITVEDGKPKSKWGKFAKGMGDNMDMPAVPSAIGFDMQTPKAAVVRGEPMSMVNPEMQAMQRQSLAQLLASLNANRGGGGMMG